jgi:hypothetical protein
MVFQMLVLLPYSGDRLIFCWNDSCILYLVDSISSKLGNVYSLRFIIRVIKSRRIR